jgi:coenzyme Q-binding protein COQ10
VMLLADMTVGYKAIRETFTSQVVLKPGRAEYRCQILDGPFKYLRNVVGFRSGAGRLRGANSTSTMSSRAASSAL